MIKILFICHGNICRSTMAQSVFQYMVDQNGLTGSFYIARFTLIPQPPAGRRSAIRRITAPGANSDSSGFPAGIIGRGSFGRKSTTGLITSSEWIPGISAILTGSSGTETRTGKCANFWILQTGRVRISQTRGIRAILM